MRIIQGLRQWWQRQTGEEETPFDGDSPAFIVSLLVNLAIVVSLGLIPLMIQDNQVTLTIDATAPEEIEEMKIPEEFVFSEQPAEEVGANSVAGEAVALSMAPVISEISQIPNHLDVETTVDNAQIEINNAIEVATGLHYNQNLAVKGAAGVGTTGAEGAIDRLTHEILLSLEERKTLVVWLFDGTASLIPQRNAIHDRFDRIYKELGIIEAAGDESFTKHEDKPLLSSIVAFGSGMQLMTKEPTDDLAELKAAVKNIPNDESGMENVFSAIHEAARHYADFRYTTAEKPNPDRNVMLVVFTDEAGTDANKAEETIKMCRRWAMPVYVVGVPAPFGRRETQMKWVDPDPKFDQTAQWGVVEQGPESYLPERIKLAFSGSKEDDEPIDSGFGPFALTRLCYETGGIYFAVHPNRNVTRAVSRGETAAFSSYVSHFFDPETMRKYRPDYVSVTEYQKRASQNKARWALVQAAQASQLTQMDSPTLRFVKSDEAAFANALSEAQQAAAALEPKINSLYEILRQGEADREKETVLRWQAGYDLAIGRALAVKVRTETYNAMLAAAKRGLKFKDEKNNTWILKPSDEISVGSQYAKLGERAKMYLNRLATDHPGTPWAMLAERELKDPLGWSWEEEFTDTSPRRMGDGNGNPNPNDARRMMTKPPPKRPPPKL
ncbi:MAG TPA: vWA domain-containing protein [Pirellulaceae bacterium]|nr:vWA domain-containing protein [Pirellulaceae bacterium]